MRPFWCGLAWERSLGAWGWRGRLLAVCVKHEHEVSLLQLEHAPSTLPIPYCGVSLDCVLFTLQISNYLKLEAGNRGSTNLIRNSDSQTSPQHNSLLSSQTSWSSMAGNEPSQSNNLTGMVPEGALMSSYSNVLLRPGMATVSALPTELR